jgi:hypothetical protein
MYCSQNWLYLFDRTDLMGRFVEAGFVIDVCETGKESGLQFDSAAKA